MNCPTRGLYAITQTEGKSLDDIVNDAAAVLQGGAVMLQYRDKNPLDAEALAKALLAVCRGHHVPLIINDDVTLAAKVGAEGVHLGRQDGNISQAREILGDQAIIGVSCYNDFERALTAQADGADYVAFGRFYTSASKPLAEPADIVTLEKAKQSLTVPIVAIGGILPENGGALLAAGADLLAVIGGLYDAGKPLRAAEAYQILFS